MRATSTNQATELANRALEQFGYVIFCFYDGLMPLPKVGDVFDYPISGGQPGLGSVHGPFRVIAEATRDEYLEQRLFLGFREYHRPPVAYFKIVAE